MTAQDVDMGDEPAKTSFSLGRLLPLLVLVSGLVAFFAFGLNDYLTLGKLQENWQGLNQAVADVGIWAPLIYIGLYIAVVAFSLPGGAPMTIAGGLLFGWMFGTIYVVIGATLGATVIFLAAKTALGDALRARAGDTIKKLEAGFQKDAFSYLLFLRLVPIFPFWLVNLVPAFLGVPLRTYVIATFVGIIPGTAVYASIGNGAGEIFEAGGDLNLGIIFQPEILAPIIGLAVLAMVPVIYKKFFKRGETKDTA